MLAINASAPIASAPEIANVQPDSWAAQRCRYWEKQAVSLVRNTLSHAIITEQQRQAAEQRFAQVGTGMGFVGKMIAWNLAVKEYIRAVVAGERDPKAMQQQAEPVAKPVVRMQIVREARGGVAARLQQLRHKLGQPVEVKQQPGKLIPMWEQAEKVEQLPTDLHWSGQGAVPALGAPVEVTRYGRKVTGEVAGYFHAEGFMGVVLSFAKQTARMKKALRGECVFGRELAAA